MSGKNDEWTNDGRERLLNLIDRFGRSQTVDSGRLPTTAADAELDSICDAIEWILQSNQDWIGQLASENDKLKAQCDRQQASINAIELERYQFQTVMDLAPDLLNFKDREGRFLAVSQSMAEFLNQTRDELVGKTDFDFFPDADAKKYRADDQRVMESGSPVLEIDETLQHPDGRLDWVSASKVPLRNEQGEVIGIFGMSRNITERKMAAQELKAAKEAADAANQAKSGFLANMSHEIRTPMNAIIGMTELLLDMELPASQRDYLNMVLDSGESLLAILNEILDFSKVEAGKIELDNQPFDVHDCVGNALKSLGLRAHSKDLELAFRIGHEVPRVLSGDIVRLRQIFVNLIGNAIKFTEVGEVVLTVELESQDDKDSTLHFCVLDTGIGIPVSKQANVFAAFEQADSSTTRRYGGTGLGLAICTRLVNLMGGKIWLESEVGKGSQFHFTARFANCNGQEDSELLPANILESRVLVVDDNSTNRRILADMLAGWGMNVASAAGAKEALATMRSAHVAGQAPELVIIDAKMPDVDGFELLKQMHSDGNLATTKIVMLTTADRCDDVARCESMQVARCLIKPIKRSELGDAVVDCLGPEDRQDENVSVARESSSDGRSLKILLAEDNIVNQKLAIGLLERAGHEVFIANNGREALSALEAQNFDVVLMDVEMPEMDGLEATAAIRLEEKKTGKHIPIIAMTAHAMQGDRERCLAACMDDYLSKPIRMNLLEEALRSLVNSSR